METLVLKVPGVVDNSSLRGMNEFRFKVTKNGEGSGRTNLGNLKSPSYEGSVVPIWEIMDGDAYFVDSSDNRLISPQKSESVRIKNAGADSNVRIKNYDLCADVLGYAESNLFDTPSADITEAPSVVFNLSELKGKTFIDEINTAAVVNGPLSDIENLTATSIRFRNNKNAISGNLRSLPQSVEAFDASARNATNNNTFTWSFDNIQSRSNLKRAILDNSVCLGGDLFSLLTSKSGNLYLNASRCNDMQEVDITCGYSGTVPSDLNINIQMLGFFQTGRLDKANTLAFLNFLKDGIDANKITVDSGSEKILLQCATGVNNDTDVVALVTTLQTSPYNVGVILY